MNSKATTHSSWHTTATALLTAVALIASLIGSRTDTFAAALPAEGEAPLAFIAAPTQATPGGTFTIDPQVAVPASAEPVTLSLVPATAADTGVLTCATNPVVATDGVAAFEACAIDASGQYTLRATVGEFSADSAPITVAVAAHQFADQPDGGVAGEAWATQPRLLLVDATGQLLTVDPAQQVELTIVPGTGTPGATLTCVSNVVDAVAGVAVYAGCSIDLAGTGYQLHAAILGDTVLGTSAPFDLSPATDPGTDPDAEPGFGVRPITPQAAGDPELTFSAAPLTAAPGSTFSINPQVTVLNSTDPVTLTLAAVTVGATGTLHCATTVAAQVAGVATFTGCSIDAGGQYTLHAAIGAFTVDSATITVAGPEFSAQPNGGVAGQAWTGQPVVRIVDNDGTPITAAPTQKVGLVIKPGTGTIGATLTCTTNPVDAVAGVATFDGCSIDKAGTGYRLMAAAQGGSVIGTSAAFNITAGAAAKVAFTTQPVGNAGGADFAVQPVTTVQDQYGNKVPGNTASVALQITTGTGTAGAIFTCGTNPVAAINGVATFAGCQIDKLGTGYTLTATAAGLADGVSAPLTVATGLLTGISFSVSPGGGAGGAAFDTQPIVRLSDAGGNSVAGTATLSIKAGTGAAGATLTCTGNPAVGSGNPIVFNGCAIDKASPDGNPYVLVASNGSLHTDSQPFAVTPGAAHSASFVTSPATGVGGEPFTIQPSVEVRDNGGNIAAGAVTLALVDGLGRPGAVLACEGGNTVNAVDGVATFSGCTIDKAGPGYRIVATVQGSATAEATSPVVDITVGAPHHLAFTTSPGGGTGGSAFAVQPVVAVHDAGGNIVIDSIAAISLHVTQGSGLGSLACSSRTLQVTSGSAVFVGCSINTAGTGYTLTATAEALTGISAPFDITVGAPVRVVFGRQPGDAVQGASFGAQPQVRITDAGGNNVPTGGRVALALTPGTGTEGATFTCASTAVLPMAGGVAAYRDCTVDRAGGGFALTATWNGITAESLPFPVLIPVVPPLEVAPTGAPQGQTFGGSAYAINPTSTVDGVNSATGSLLHVVNDLRVAGVGPDFVLDRTYNSLDSTGGSFGPGWTSLFDLSVALSANGLSATVRGEDGQQLVFTRTSAGGAWVAPAGARADLACADATCTVTRWDGTSWTVTGARLDSYLDANGQGLRFSHPNDTTTVVEVATTEADTSTDVTVTHEDGLITKVATPTREATFGYTDGLLTSVTDVRGHTWRYAYTANRLTSITDPQSQQRLVVAYDPVSGRVVAAATMGGPERTDNRYEYDAPNQRSIRRARTNVAGTVTDAMYVDTYRDNVLVRQEFPEGIGLRYSYDAQLNLIALQDPMGFVQQFTYSSNGDLTSQTMPVSDTEAAVVRLTYDDAHRVLSQTDANGNTHTYEYDGPNVVSIVDPAPSKGATLFAYDGLGQLVEITTPIGRQSFEYDAAGNEARMLESDLSGNALNGKGTLVTYDESGNKTSFVDARGTTRNSPAAYTTSWEYDPAGNLLTFVDPIGTTTTFTYDDAGDISGFTSPEGFTTYLWSEHTLTRTIIGPAGRSTQTFDPSGNVLVEGSPIGGRTVHVYDAFAREVATTDAACRTTRFTYEPAGNVVHATADDQPAVRRQFDSLNRMIRTSDATEEMLSTYDLVGNVLESADNTGVTTREYDSRRNLTSVTNAAGTTTYQYDLANNVERRTDARGGITTYSYDGMARVTEMQVDGKATTYRYDEAGNLAQTTDPEARVTTLTVDALNRTTSTAYEFEGDAASRITVDQTFDWRNRRTSMTDSNGTNVFEYDTKGNLVSAGTAGGTFTYDHSLPGITRETYPDGTTVQYSTDGAGALMALDALSPDGDVSANYLRDYNRRTAGIAFSNGVLQTRSYDAAGNVSAQSVQHLATVLAGDTYTYDANGNRLTQRTTGAGRSVSNAYAYDADGRVVGFASSSTAVAAVSAAPSTSPAATGSGTGNGKPTLPGPASLNLPTPQPGGAPTGDIAAAPADWTYDEVGNRTSDGATSSTYGAGDTIAKQPGTTWTYDDSGAVTRLAGPTGTRSFTYDAAARLVRVDSTVGGDDVTIEYAYDGDGNRIERTADDVTTTYTWDPMRDIPLLVIERDSDGAVQRRYFHGEGTVAMQTPAHTYYFHLDPLGSTNQVTDERGKVVAAFSYDAFGVVTETGPAADRIDLLFQGQQLDRATGLYNMRARHYDPVSGRFTQREPMATPIGVPLVSAYAFVGNQPTKLTDPSGLTAITPSTVRPQVNENADKAYDAKFLTTALTVGIKGGAKIAELSGKGSMAAGKVAGEVGSKSAAVSNASKAVKGAGIALAVIGIGLQTYLTIETCKHGPVEKCVASSVGLAINVAFTVGCSFITSGAGAAACAIGGAVLGIALEYVIGAYGPEIADAFVAGYEATAAAFSSAAAVTLEGLSDFADATTAEYNRAVAELTDAYEATAGAFTSGYQATLDALTDAGYKAEEIANLMRDTFSAAARETVAALVNLGYDIQAGAEALAKSFLLTAEETAQLLKDGFNATVDVVATALTDLYDLTAIEMANVLKDVEFAVSEVATALQDTYGLVAEEVAGLLDDVGYEFEQIAGALTDGLGVLVNDLNDALSQVAHTAEQFAASMRAFYDLAAATAADLLRQAGYLVDEVANALKDAYATTVAAAAVILQSIGYFATDVADALKDVYATTAAAVTQLLKDAGYLIDDIAGALTDVYASTVAEVTGFFKNVGYSVQEIGTLLADGFAQTAEQAAQLLKDAGFLAHEVANALMNVFDVISDFATAEILAGIGYAVEEIMSALTFVYGTLSDGVAMILRDLGYAVDVIADALSSVYNLAAQAVASLLQDIGYTVAEIGAVLENVFNEIAAGAAAILQSIGAAAADIANVLEDTFNQTTAAIGGLLTDLGFSSSVISDIGGAFSDFGDAVEDFFGSIF